MAINPLPQSIKDSLQTNPIVMTFGSNGFFGYAPYRTDPEPRLMWWSTFSSATPPPRDLAIDTIKTQLLARHADWVDPRGEQMHRVLIEQGTDGEMMVLPTWITPYLPRYAVDSGRVVLLGDAAHAMPPESGQGASLALEDAQAFTLLLKHFLENEKEEDSALADTAKAFVALRKGRTEYILTEAKRRGEIKKPLTWCEEKLRDWTLWIIGFTPERWQDWKLGYDVDAEVKKYLATQ